MTSAYSMLAWCAWFMRLVQTYIGSLTSSLQVAKVLTMRLLTIGICLPSKFIPFIVSLIIHVRAIVVFDHPVGI